MSLHTLFIMLCALMIGVNGVTAGVNFQAGRTDGVVCSVVGALGFIWLIFFQMTKRAK